MKRLYLRTWQSLKLRQLIVRLRKEILRSLSGKFPLGRDGMKYGRKRK